MPKESFYNERYKVAPEVQEKLLKSRRDTERCEKKVLYCPICGGRIIGFYTNERPILDVKCRKCKFTGPVNTMYFRRVKKKPQRFL